MARGYALRRRARLKSPKDPTPMSLQDSLYVLLFCSLIGFSLWLDHTETERRDLVEITRNQWRADSINNATMKLQVRKLELMERMNFIENTSCCK